MNDQAQLLKGVLEGCILRIIKYKKQAYGYEVVMELRKYGFGQCTEGTIYPLLTRLEKKGSLQSEKKKSPFGPQRKYYSLTAEGVKGLQEFYSNWTSFKKFVENIFRNYSMEE